MPISYSIAIDRNDDGDYTDLNEAIATDVLDVRWRLGFERRYAPVASPARAEITVRNYDGTYSPERNSLLTGKRVQIQSDDGTIVRTHFTGEIAQVEPQAGSYGQQTSIIHVQGREVELAENRVRLPALQGVRADEVLDAIFDRLTLRYAVIDGYCLIDVSGYNTIDSVSIFADNVVTRQFDTGKSTFAYVGDTWSSGVRADVALREVSQSEGGRFFFNRAGAAVFHNRHHIFITPDTQATFTDDMDDMAYVYGADRITQVDVHIRPRTIGADNTLMWSLAAPLRLKRDETYTILARYEIDDEPVGLISTPVIQHVVHRGISTTSPNLTDDVQIVVMDAGFSAASIEIRNKAGEDVFLHELELYGTPLIKGNQMTMTASDALNRTLYGLHVFTLDLAMLTDIDEAATVADYEFKRRSVPRGIVTMLRTNTHQHPTETLKLTLFDRIEISESKTGHDSAYRIIAEEHHVSQGGARHEVVWLLEPDDTEIFFVIDTHDLDDVQVLLPR